MTYNNAELTKQCLTLCSIIILLAQTSAIQAKNSTVTPRIIENVDLYTLEGSVRKSALPFSSILSDIVELMPMVEQNISYSCQLNLEEFKTALQHRKAWAIKGGCSVLFIFYLTRS